jgi:hypothetical protein
MTTFMKSGPAIPHDLVNFLFFHKGVLSVLHDVPFSCLLQAFLIQNCVTCIIDL